MKGLLSKTKVKIVLQSQLNQFYVIFFYHFIQHSIELWAMDSTSYNVFISLCNIYYLFVLRDIYVAMEKPEELSFGHVKETPHDWEQRFEKLNLKNLNRQGKVY